MAKTAEKEEQKTINNTIQVNEVRATRAESAVKAYASITFEGLFKTTISRFWKIALTGEPFTVCRTTKPPGGERNQPQYQDICYPVTKEFREQLYGDIMEAYGK